VAENLPDRTGSEAIALESGRRSAIHDFATIL
jgi:hypothetical protein